MVLRPPDLKALIKLTTEEIARRYSDRYGLRVVVLRPLSVYGVDESAKRSEANVISLFAWALASGARPVLWLDGSQTRDFVFASDVARAFALALRYQGRFDAFNVATGIETNFRDIIVALGENLSVTPSIETATCPLPVYAHRLCGNPDKAAQVLGFRSEVTVAQGVALVAERAKDLVRADPTLGSAQLEYHKRHVSRP